MFLKTVPSRKGDVLFIVESYYDKENNRTRQRKIQNLGLIEDLKKEYPDPMGHFRQVAKDMTAEKDAMRNTVVTIDRTSIMPVTESNLKNVGYGIFKRLYKDLKLDVFWRTRTRGMNIEYSVDEIFKLLTFARILYPGSKKHTYDHRDMFFEDMGDFALEDVYRCLDVIDKYKEDLQNWIFTRSAKLIGRDLSNVYYDCTNYYFDIGCPDIDMLDEEGNPVDKDGNPTKKKYRKRGPEKNHRPDPIVGMGLLMDNKGIPVSYDLFPGNESEKVHMRPGIERLKRGYADSRVIIVADRGLNTADNIYYINGTNKAEHNRRDGYVYGQSVRGADSEFKGWVLEKGYRTDKVLGDDGNEITFKHKSRIQVKTININVKTPNGKTKKKAVDIDQKQMAYYSEKYARKQRMARDTMVDRAKDLIAHPKKYDRVSSAGSAAYIQNIAFDKDSGVVVEGRALELDQAKIDEEAKYDGYYSIVTSELEMDDFKLRDIYRGLSKIEDTFKISKSEFESRPVYVRTIGHIDGHFATCFTALVLIRLLQTKLDWKYPVGKILSSLRDYCCVKLDGNIHQFVYYDEILAECGRTLGIELSAKYRTRMEIRRLLKY